MELMINNNISDEEARPAVDYGKIRIGAKPVEDAILKLGDFKKAHASFGDKDYVLKAIHSGNVELMREISNFYFRVSGIYSRLCRYMAYLYRYDWMVTPYMGSLNDNEKIIQGFNQALNLLDGFNVKKFLGSAALKVIINGSDYGYVIRHNGTATVQKLPVKYCRSRFQTKEGKPIVEFNMKFFDDTFRDANQRLKMLSVFPQDFLKGYHLYKAGKLLPEFPGDTGGWYMLDTQCAFKFNLNDEDYPPFISVIPAIIDLDAAKALDRKKMEQKLLKILIQKLPMTKDGDPVFDPEEGRELHTNAVQMLSRAIGIDVLTSYADVDVEDMADDESNATDELERVERAIYNEAGVSQMQFNTDGNIALEKSILNDEAALYNLIAQFEEFLNYLLAPLNRTPKKVLYKVQLLSTTIYNYKEMSKLYKEQTQLGYSKMLPQIALGQSQSSILANAFFENDVLDLVNVFIPPMSSNVMNAEAIRDMQNRGKGESGSQGGRPEKADDEKSEKTIMNKESQN